MKRWFAVISAVAIVNLSALLALVGWARSQGWLTPERVQAAMAALRGEENTPPMAATQPAAVVEPKKPSRDLIEENAETAERQRIELTRREREIQDGWRLLEAQQLAFLREKESFAAERKRWTAEQERRLAEAGDSGLKKELEIISGLKPTEAREQLRLKTEADAVRLLMDMDARKARKIVGACKTEEERLWIGRILGKLHEQNATQAEALGAGS